MERLTAILPKENADALLRRLMRLRCVSLTKEELQDTDLTPADSAAAITSATERAARVDKILPTLQKYSRRKKPLFSAQTPCDFASFSSSGEEERAEKTIAETERIEKRKGELTVLTEKDNLLKASLLPYLSMPYPLCGYGTKTTVLLLGTIPASAKKAVLEECSAKAGFVPEIWCEDTTGVYLSLLVHKDEAEKVLRTLSPMGFTRAEFKGETDTAVALFDKAEKRLIAYREEQEQLQAQLQLLADNLGCLEALSDKEHTTRLAEEHKKNLFATKRSVVLTGWCPTRAKAKVIAAIEAAEGAFDFAPPTPEDDVPILLRNNSFARNFEWVLGMYAYPKYGRFDPTFIMSIFYFLIFGLMFADAGYGLLLSLTCFLAAWKLPLRDGMKRFMLMFGYCGISSMIFGVLFGAYFGNFPLAFMQTMLGYAPEQMPNLSLLPSLEANVAILFDPLQNPMGFLLVSLGVGALHLVAGMAVRSYILCRDRHPLTALFDIGSYWLLFAGIGVYFLRPTVGLPLALGGVLAILLTQGRTKKGVAGKLIGGFGGLYALINYASDLLSYSRILALGLASAVIAQVINTVATMKGFSFIGLLLMVLVFTIGHLLNLVINVLGTFVHTARLQYIEFFGKFYEDGGTPFRPMAPSDKYTLDVSNATTPTQT